MRKATNNTIKSVKIFEKHFYSQDGSARMSNNLCEQRVKLVKRLLKNCVNVGSEVTVHNGIHLSCLGNV